MENKVSVGKSIIWWEKSVEYLFIAQMVKEEMFQMVVPLSGNAESALGDAILKWTGGKLLLIEFKADNSSKSMTSEHKKYAASDEKENAVTCKMRFKIAKELIKDDKGVDAHGFIFGKEDHGKLLLCAAPYWGASKSKKQEADDTKKRGNVVLDWCEKNGVSVEVFDKYLSSLASLRYAISKSGDGSGDGSGGSRSFVVGIGKKKEEKFAIELDDYVNLRRLTLKYKKPLTITNTIPNKNTTTQKKTTVPKASG